MQPQGTIRAHALQKNAADELKKVQQLEQELGRRVLALKTLDVGYEELSDDAVEKIRELEDELGLLILAVK